MKFDWYRLIPKYWFQSYPTSWEWDEVLNRLLDNHRVEIEHLTAATVGEARVCIYNYPGGFGYLYNLGNCYLPSVKTRKRLHKIVKKQSADEKERHYRQALQKAKKSIEVSK